MKLQKYFGAVLSAALLFSMVPAQFATAQSPSAPIQSTHTLTSMGAVDLTTAITTAGADEGQVTAADFAQIASSQSLDRDPRAAFANANRPAATNLSNPPAAAPVDMMDASTGEGARFSGFAGINHRQQRLANGGNQFSLEPPDQGLCAGNGYVLESVNDALRLFTSAGAAASGVVDLNTFFGMPAAIVRATGVRGPSVGDPKCYYDTATQRWFLTVYDIDSGKGGTGRFFVALAVSQSANPLGAWNRYLIDVTDDGLNGTPSHTGCPCLGDQPLIGADANGFYISTNEFPWFVNGFNGAQVYAISKQALANGTASSYVMFENLPLAEFIGYSVQPATSPAAKDFDLTNGGTEYFMSALDFYGTLDNRVAVWALTNTQSLSSNSPQLGLQSLVVQSETYGQPPVASQKVGSQPLHDCINDTTSPTPFGPGCWQFFFFSQPPAEPASHSLNSNDDRMNQVVYANHQLWGALNTILSVKGQTHSGIAYFETEPKVKRGVLSAKLDHQGYVAVPGNDAVFPSVAVTSDGNVVVAFTVTGPDYYPSAAFSKLDVHDGSHVRLAAAGVGPHDGFTGYNVFSGNVARWGDYSAAVAVGDTVWMSTEYIGQSCTLAQYMTGAFGSCGGTRTSLANWGTFVYSVKP
jgi:hypothetical protein